MSRFGDLMRGGSSPEPAPEPVVEVVPEPVVELVPVPEPVVKVEPKAPAPLKNTSKPTLRRVK